MIEMISNMKASDIHIWSAAFLLLLFPLNTMAQFGPNDTPRNGNSWQYRLPTGDIVRVQHNSDGSTGWTINSNCNFCFGTGTCQSCYGQGGKQIGSFRYGYWNTCGMCGGLGRCNHCNGKGKVERYYHFDQYGTCTTINPYTLQMEIFDASACGITPQIREKEFRNYNSSRNSNEGTICPMCKGNKNYTIKTYTTTFPNDMYCDVCREWIKAGIVSRIHSKCKINSSGVSNEWLYKKFWPLFLEFWPEFSKFWPKFFLRAYILKGNDGCSLAQFNSFYPLSVCFFIRTGPKELN